VLKCMFSRPSSRVYLVDFAVHKGLDEWKFSKDLFIPMSAQTGVSSCVETRTLAASLGVVMTSQRFNHAQKSTRLQQQLHSMCHLHGAKAANACRRHVPAAWWCLQ
jgi:hypothetical protein